MPAGTRTRSPWWARLARAVQRDAVSICIPAWQSQAFIDRTLDFALGQTHPRVRVLISVDRGEDDTAAICLERARRDRRLAVCVQSERLGWAGNVNALLERVSTPYFFLYFHDDVIAPQYTERLLKLLQRRPDAASAHCDMDHFGASRPVSTGRDYEGSAAQRLAAFLVAPERGSPLRSLTRSSHLAGGLRMPGHGPHGLWANEPYLMQLVAAGPALHLPEILYYRWNQREGGLTDGWKRLAPADVEAGHMANIRAAFEIIDRATGDPVERRALAFCLRVHALPRLRNIERASGGAVAFGAEAMPRFIEAASPGGLDCLGPDIRGWALDRYRKLLEQERRPGTAGMVASP